MAIDFGGDAKYLFEQASKQVRDDATPILEFLSVGFTITWFREYSPRVWIALLKPHPELGEYFTLPMEYVLIGHGFPTDFQQRTLLAEPSEEVRFRVDNRVRFVASGAPMMKAACAAWATERRIAVVPIDSVKDARAGKGIAHLYELLSNALWRRDVFDDPEPVADPAEFFGRELVVQQIATKAYLGQLTAVFGLRKIGKTSLLRRVMGLLEADTSVLNVAVLIQCNATRVKSGRWHVILGDLVDAWAAGVNKRALASGLKTQVRPTKLGALLSAGRPVPADGQIADAFQKDVEKILKAARSVIRGSSGAHVRLIALFDEVDELYPYHGDAGYWREDYFLLWNTLQTLKRGLEDPRELVYILGGVNPAGVEAGVLLDRPNPLFELSRLFLRPLTEAESEELMSGLGARIGMSFEAPALACAYEITGGHPWLLRKLGSQIHQLEGGRSAKFVVNREMVERVFERTKRSFFQHVEWILSHLRSVAPDEYRLLRDIAIGGNDRYMSEWADQTFRETFAEHLAQYGVLVFNGAIPSISIGIVRDVLAAPGPQAFRDQKSQIREAGDTLEALMRMRLVADIARERTIEEAVAFIVDNIPREAKNRPNTRDELRALGEANGLHALIQALNWGDYTLLLRHAEAGIAWSGSALPDAERFESIERVFALIHLARHNNDAELRAVIDSVGFDALWSGISVVMEMFAQ